MKHFQLDCGIYFSLNILLSELLNWRCIGQNPPGIPSFPITVVGCLFSKSLSGCSPYQSSFNLKILTILNEGVLTIGMNTGIAARPSDLLMLHYYFTYCKTGTVSSLVNIFVFCYQISTPSCMLGVHSCLWGTATCVLSVPAYPPFISSVCFDGNYYLWMQETRGEKNLSFLAMEHTSRLWVFLARLPPQIFGAPVGFALQSLIAARGECVVISNSRQVQLNNPPLQRQAFYRAFSSHVCYCQPPPQNKINTIAYPSHKTENHQFTKLCKKILKT